MTDKISQEDAAYLIKRSYDDPVFFAKEILGVNLWDRQIQIIESIRDNANTCVASGHGVGKTFISAVATLWFLCTHDQSRVITTAPTNRQVESILWAEIWNLYKRARVPLGGKLLKTSLNIEEKWFAIGMSTDDPDRFVGHHAMHMLLIMDEAPGIDPKIYEASQGILTQEGSKCLLIGNPTSPSGPFFDAFHNKLWNSFHISCYDSPAIKDPLGYPSLTSNKWIEERKAEWGEKSPMFVSRVLGEFPIEGEDTLIPLTWCTRAVMRWEKSKDACKVSDHVYLGLDVARYGINKTVLTNYIPNRLMYQKSIQNKSTTEATQLAIKDGITAGAKLMQITTDDTGLGGGVTDRLRELGYPVLAINFSQKPTDMQHFKGIRDEMYWNLRELFRSDEIAIPNLPTLINQLSSIKYKIDPRTGKIEIENKDEMKKRGQVSPDEADSLAIAVWGAKRMKASGQFRRRAVGRQMNYGDVAYY
jgi:phage terminase large subunit